MRILVTGSSGYLGQHLLYSLCRNEDYEITASYGELPSFTSDCESSLFSSEKSSKNSNVKLVDRSTLDISDAASVKSFLSNRTFDVVIHLAAMSSPFQCEKNPKAAMAINLPIPLLDALCENKPIVSDGGGSSTLRPITFIFLSTDQVYDGLRAPYEEGDPTEPVNLYGKTKLDFELALLNRDSSRIKPIILRSSLILGGVAPLGSCRKQSFLQFVRDRLEQKKETIFFTNEYRSVVYVGDVVNVICHFVRHCSSDCNKLDNVPVYNMGGRERVSRYDIAVAVAKHLGLDSAYAKAEKKSIVSPSSASDENNIIVRSPPDIAMNSKKLEAITKIKMFGLEDIVQSSLKSFP